MNKSQFVEALSAHFEGNKKAAGDALDAVIETITREVAKGEKVALTGFASFEKIVKDARTGRNPATGAKIRIKKKAVPRVKVGADFRNVVSGAKKLPKLAVKTASSAASSAAKTAAPAKKAAAKKTTAAKKATATKSAPAKKTAAKTTSAAKKTAAKKSAPAKKTAAKKSAPAKKTAAKKAPAKKSTAKKAPAKRS